MSSKRGFTSFGERTTLILVLLLFAGMSVVGITWGLPSRAVDTYLFGDQPPWPGEEIYRLAGAGGRFSSQRGADVDVDPVDASTNEPILLTGSDEDLAKIYLRYRLYTYQPDEMITMMALAGMKPGRLQLDPRLYQYGGLFVYPVGALIGACGAIGLIDVRSDVVYYLDHPAEFGKFYIVARAYAAAWGLLGAIVVFAIGRRLGGSRVGFLAALLFMLMPVVVCMAHEGKPHLPGATLMLLAVYFAMRHLEDRSDEDVAEVLPSHRLRPTTIHKLPTDEAAGSPTLPADDVITSTRTTPACTGWSQNWWLMCICCGAAFGMVLSSWPIFVLIPLVAVLDHRRQLVGSAAVGGADGSLVGTGWFTAIIRTLVGTVIGVAVYLAGNPYILINAFTNREVLCSNFGNSLAMYDIARVGEGFVRVLELTLEGASLPVVVLGVLAAAVALARKNSRMIPLLVPAFVFFLQFVLIGAGKPAEYGRFGIFTNAALAIGTAGLLCRRWRGPRGLIGGGVTVLVVLWVAIHGGLYLHNFYRDTTDDCTRIRLAKEEPFGGTRHLQRAEHMTFAVLADPAPYCFPPINFSRADIYLLLAEERFAALLRGADRILVKPVDQRRDGAPGSVTNHLLPPQRFAPSSLRGRLRRLVDWLRARETPISWANKPFYVASPDEWRAEHMTVQPD